MAMKFFRFTFAQNGNKQVVNDETQVGGILSYEEGYGSNYSLDPNTAPTALRIQRDRYNQVENDVTNSLQIWQLRTYPDWVPAADNGGVLVSYSLNSVVLYSGQLRVSLVDANNTEPNDNTKWNDFPNDQDLGIFYWKTTTTYNLGSEVVGSDGLIYKSKTGSNIGNDPTLDFAAANWSPVFDQSGRAKPIDSGGGAINVDDMNENFLGLWGVTGGNGWLNQPAGVSNYGWLNVIQYSDSLWLIQRYTVNNQSDDGTWHIWQRLRDTVGTWSPWLLVGGTPIKAGDFLNTMRPYSQVHENSNFSTVRAFGNRGDRSIFNSEVADNLPLEDNWVKSVTNLAGQVREIRATADGSVYIAVTGKSQIQAGGIWRSTDQGTTWTRIVGAASPQDGIKSHNCLTMKEDGSVMLIGLDNSIVLRSTDLGLNWTQINIPNSPNIEDIEISSGSNEAVLVGVDGTNQIANSSDAGLNWTVRSQPAGIQAISLYGCYVNSLGNFFLASGDTGAIWTSNDGINWNVRIGRKNDGTGSGLPGNIQFLAGDDSGSNWIAGGNNGFITTSTQGFSTWDAPRFLTDGDGVPFQQYAINDVFCTRNGRCMMMVGDGHTVYRSFDGGINWMAPNGGGNELRTDTNPTTCYISDNLDRFFVGYDSGDVYVAGLNTLAETPKIGLDSYIAAKFIGN